MRLIDADELIYLTIGEDTDNPFKFVPIEIIENAEEVEAIPVEWLRKQYPMNAKYCGDAYMNKAKIIRGVIREYEDYVFNRQVHNVVEDINDDRK